MSWVMIHHGTVMCGWNARPCLWPGAGTAWPRLTTSSTRLGVAMTTKTPQSASTSCRWSPTTHAVASGLGWHRCCCPTVRPGLQSGQGGSTCLGATAGRVWHFPEPLRCTPLTRTHGPEVQTCQNALQGPQHVCALWSLHHHHPHRRTRRWDKGWNEYHTPHKNSSISDTKSLIEVSESLSHKRHCSITTRERSWQKLHHMMDTLCTTFAFTVRYSLKRETIFVSLVQSMQKYALTFRCLCLFKVRKWELEKVQRLGGGLILSVKLQDELYSCTLVCKKLPGRST